MTLREHVIAAKARLTLAGVPDPDAAHDAEYLARHVLHWDRAAYVVRRHDTLPPRFDADYARVIERRAAREPVSLILGTREFWGLEFEVSGATLTPRPETELLVECALRTHDPTDHRAWIVDVGTGCGCLAIAIATERPRARIVATDASFAALRVACRNARRHGVDDRVTFLQTDVLGSLVPHVDLDLIVSNPPYVESGAIAELAPEVRVHEPRLALDGGPDGMAVIHRLLDQAATRLRPGAQLLFEFGAGQVSRVTDAVRAVRPLEFQGVHDDLRGIPRVAVVKRRRDREPDLAEEIP